MEFFKKKEPLIVADMAADALPPTPIGVPAGSMMSSTGSLTKMVEETLALETENNRMLKRMQALDHISFWIKIVVWSLVLGLPVIFFQPLLAYLKQSIIENPAMFGIPSSAEFYKAVNDFSTKHPVQ